MISKTTFLFNFISCLLLVQAQYGLENLGAEINSRIQQSLQPLNDLGARINNQVQRETAHLNNLGAQINSQVQRNVAPLDNLGARISGEVQEQVAPLYDLGPQINRNVQEQLAPLQDLDTKINQQVYQALEPVRILESIVAVKQGSRGRTVATFSPIGKQFIIKNGQLFQCSGSISDSDGSCSGDLSRFAFNKKEDFCFAPSKAIINNWYCITANGATATGFVNGKVICQSNDGSPKLLIEASAYKELCKDVTTASYKYYTNNKLQHVGNGLKCSGNNPQTCTYSETLDTTSNIINTYSSGSNIYISNNY